MSHNTQLVHTSVNNETGSNKPMNLRQVYQQAQEALQNRNYHDAEKIYKAILDSRPEDQLAQFGLSVITLEFNKPDDALGYLQPLLSQNTEEEVYRIQWLKIALSKGQYSNVLEQANVWSSQTQSPDLHWFAGNAARALGKWEQAEEHYTQGLSIQSEHPEIQAELALLQAWRPRGNKDEAQDNIFTLAERYPQVLTVLNNAAHILLLNHNPKIAGSLLTLALKLKHRDPDTLALRAKWLHQTGDLEASRKAFAQAINACKVNFLGYAYLGWLFIDLNRLYDAIFCFTQAINNQPAFYQEADKLAELLYYYSNASTKAITALNKAIPVNPCWGRLYARKAFMQWVCTDLEDPTEKAKATLEKGQENCLESCTDIHVVRSVLAASKKDWDTLRRDRKASKNANFFGLGSYAKALEKRERGYYKEAEKAIKQALKIVPNLSLYQYTKAQILTHLNKPQKAVNLLENILQYHPRDPDSRRMLIDLLVQLGRNREAMRHETILMKETPQVCEKLFQKRLQKDPDNPKNKHGYAKALSHQPDRREEALAYIDSILKSNPTWHQLLTLKGDILRNMEHYPEAEEVFNQVLEQYPADANTYAVLAQILLNQEKWEEAESVALKAYDIKKHYRTIVQLAQTFRELGGHIDKVLELLDEAIALAPDNPVPKWEKAYTCFHNNRLPEAMELYHHGFESGARQPYRKFNVPEWDGKTDIKGKRILCWREQGIGDEVRFSRYYQDLINTGAYCIFEVSPKLKPLFKRSFPDAEILIARGNDDLFRSDIDYHIPSGTLMRYFMRDCSEPPFYKNYYILSEGYLQKWRTRLSELGDGLKVGINWRSMYRTASRNVNYMTIEELEPLFDLPGIIWVNLQYDECEEELKKAKEKFGVTIHNWSDLNQKDDLDQTAAIISLLDLAMGVAAPATMAQNLGIPVIRWQANSTMARESEVVRSHLHYPALIFNRHYKQSKKDLAGQIAEHIRENYLRS